MNQVKLSNNVKRETVLAENTKPVGEIIEEAGMSTGCTWQLGGIIIDNLGKSLKDLGVADDCKVWINRVVKADCAC